MSEVFHENDQLIIPNGFIPGCLPRTDSLGDTFASRVARYETYPRDEWEHLAAHNVAQGLLAQLIYNQQSEGSCNCQAAAQAMNLTYRATNSEWTPPDGFSAMLAYKHFARGPNQGTVIGDVLKFHMEVGNLPLDTAENRDWMKRWGLNSDHVMPMTGWHTPFPRGWEETAQHFRIADATDCGRAAEVISAILDNKVGVLGVDMHAMAFDQCHKDGRSWMIDVINSWGRWGSPIGPSPAFQYGRGSVSEQKLDAQIRSYGAYCIESVHISDIFDRP